MTVFRDWPRELRSARLGRARFYVDRDSVETGRRLIVHEFPHRDTPYVEDMGRNAYRISVTAYVVGNDSDSEALLLRSECESRGPKQLSLPLERFLVHCEKVQRDFSKDKLGLVAFSLSLVREGVGAAPFPVAVLGHQVNLAIGAVLGPLRAAFGIAFAGIGVASFVASAAVSVLRNAAALMSVALMRPGIDILRVPALAVQIGAMFDNAAALTAFGSQATRLSTTSFVTEGRSNTDPEVVGLIWEVVNAIGEAASAAEAIEILEPLATFMADSVPDIPSTPSERRLAQNEAALGGVVRIAALAAIAAAVVDVTISDRREGIALRARVATLFAAERERAFADSNHELSVAIEDVSGHLVDHISRRIVDLAPMLDIVAPISMPSLWWSNRIYGTHERAGDLARRNRVIHPSFMPTRLEALAR